MKARPYTVKRVSRLPRIKFEGMDINFLIDKKEMKGKMAAYFIRMSPGTVVPPSYHKVANEIIVVLSGSGEARLNKDRVKIRKGDVMLVRPRTWHSFTTGRSSLRLLAVLSPYVDSRTDLYHR